VTAGIAKAREAGKKAGPPATIASQFVQLLFKNPPVARTRTHTITPPPPPLRRTTAAPSNFYLIRLPSPSREPVSVNCFFGTIP